MTNQFDIKRLVAMGHEGEEMVQRIMPILAGHDPEVKRGVIFKLLALSLATCPPDKREQELGLYLAALPGMIEIYDHAFGS
jgi:hypothetical protein